MQVDTQPAGTVVALAQLEGGALTKHREFGYGESLWEIAHSDERAVKPARTLRKRAALLTERNHFMSVRNRLTDCAGEFVVQVPCRCGSVEQGMPIGGNSATMRYYVVWNANDANGPKIATTIRSGGTSRSCHSRKGTTTNVASFYRDLACD